jgi:hypothetical protein
MRSNMSMVLASFGVLFLSFGFVILLLGWLGVHYHARESMGSAGLIGIVFVTIGAVLFGAGRMGRSKAAA